MATIPQPPIDEQQVHAYLTTLFGPALDAGPEAEIVPTVLPQKLNGDEPPVSRGFKTIAGATEWICQRAAHNNLYVHIALHTPGVNSKGSVETALELTVMAADLDAASPYRKSNKDHAPDVHSLVMLCKEFEQLYRVRLIIVRSGFGVYPMLLFREPWVLETAEDRKEASQLLRRFKLAFEQLAEPHGWKGSVELVDLSKILRVPGTLNHKCQPPLPVTVEMPEGYLGVNPSELDELLPELPEETKVFANAPAFTINPNAEPPAALLRAMLTNDTKFAFSWNRERPDLKDQSLSGYELSLANITALAGWAPQQIVDLLVEFRRKYGKPPKHRVSYAITLKKALGTAAGIQARRESAAFDAAPLVATAGPLELLNAAKAFHMGSRRLRIKDVLQRGQRFILIDEQDRQCDLGTIEQFLKPAHAQARILRDLFFGINPNGKLWFPAAALIREIGALNYEDVEDSTEDETRSWLAQALRPLQPSYCNAWSRHEIYGANESVASCDRGKFIYQVHTRSGELTMVPQFILWRHPAQRLMVHPPTLHLWGTSPRGLDKRNLTITEVNQRLDALGFKKGVQETGRNRSTREENQQRWSISPPRFEVEPGANVQPGWSKTGPENADDDLT